MKFSELFTLFRVSYQVIMDVAGCYNLHRPQKYRYLKSNSASSIAIRKIAYLAVKLNLNLLV